MSVSKAPWYRDAVSTFLLALMVAAARVKVAATGLQAAEFPPPVAEAWVERIATIMGENGVTVTTQRDVAQLLGLERQRQLLGCAEDSSDCLVELAGGLGVDGVLTGSVAKSGSSYLVTLKVLRANTGAVWASASGRVAGEDELNDFFDSCARRFATELVGAGPAPARLVRWVPAIAGVLVGAGGATLYGLSKADAATLRTAATVPNVNTAGVAARGSAFEAAGLTLIGVGAAAIAASVVWVLAARDAPAVSVAPLQGGAALVVGGPLP